MSVKQGSTVCNSKGVQSGEVQRQFNCNIVVQLSSVVTENCFGTIYLGIGCFCASANDLGCQNSRKVWRDYTTDIFATVEHCYFGPGQAVNV